MKYADYQVEDFLADADFVNWVNQPDAQSNRFWEAFLRDHPSQQAVVRQARAVVLNLRFDEEPVTDATVKAEWERLRDRLTRDEQPEETGRVIPFRPVRQWGWLAGSAMVAATVAGLLVGFFWWTNQPVPDQVYRTAYGQIRQLQLPDGSDLTLNANSEVRLPGDWNNRPVREVWLKGEGFFHVVKRKASPGRGQSRFVVHAGEVDVEVLGTAFNVQSRRRQADVLLQSGSVRLTLTEADTARSLLMRPGDGVRYQAVSGQLSRRLVSPGLMAAWTQGVLHLDHMTLGELGQVIEDTYGRRVVIRSPKLASRVLSGSLPTRNERALLEGIAVTLNVPVRVDKNVVVFGE